MSNNDISQFRKVIREEVTQIVNEKISASEKRMVGFIDKKVSTSERRIVGLIDEKIIASEKRVIGGIGTLNR